MNLRPSGYEPDELPGCSTPRDCGAMVRRGLRSCCGSAAGAAGVIAKRKKFVCSDECAGVCADECMTCV